MDIVGSPDMFVGREHEMTVLRGKIAAVREGRGGIILVSGPAGIGKSRLVEEAVADAPGVVRGRCVADDGAPPLWPWLRILRRIRADLLPTELTGTATGVTAMDASESAGERFRLLAGLTDALLAAAEDFQGLVVVIEDLHDADEVSLALLRQVAIEAAHSWLLVIATHRDAATRQATDFVRTLVDLAHSGAASGVALTPFAVSQVARYLTAVPGGVALASLVHQRTGGLPLLVSAMARLLRKTDAARDSRGRLPTLPPADLRLIVAGMLAGLDPEARETVAAAAALGEGIDLGLLADVTDLFPAAVAGHLAALAQAGLLTVTGDAPPRYRFTHALVREGVVAESARVAATLHRRAALALERRVGADPAHAARIAAHWQRATEDDNDTKALRATVRWTRAAAAYALSALSPEEAASLLGQALETLDRTGGAGHVERAELLIELATAEYVASRIPECTGHCWDAADAADAAGRPDLLIAAALVLRGVADPAAAIRTAALCDRALSALEAAGDVTGADRDGGVISSVVARARLLARKACLEAESIRSADGASASAEALRLAEACGDRTALVDAVRARVGTLGRPEDVNERLRLGDLAISAGMSPAECMITVLGHTWRLDAAYQLANLSAVDDEVARLGELRAALYHPHAHWYHLRVLAARAALGGRFDSARSHSLEARQVATRMGDPFAVSVSGCFATVLALMRGDPREIPEGYPASLAPIVRIPVVGATHALCLYLTGETDEAFAEYEHLRLLLREPISEVRGMVMLQLLTELVEAFDDSEAAAWAHADWLPWAATAGLPGDSITFSFGSCARGVGRMAAIMGRLDEAIDALRTAVDVNLRLDARPWLTHTWLTLADVLRRRAGPGDHAEAAGLATRAAAEARRLDLPGPLARAHRSLIDIETRRRADDPLTTREREVAALVAKALSNRQIAERLVLSERTIESHVRNTLTKLGLNNRTELAAHLLGEQRREHPPGK
ncbi:helix-turn-helix transcriptional regulator [Actinoallomurus bryophytorum]|uniref:helix-turn-helix transcriptional regulator n=1 Tax=Actinoallomurus bryophytorum TaxID=1490222 RepID=UPI001153A202|nr:LuxR family transcriptional regulator [Actinoallomurus bryophytorum]